MSSEISLPSLHVSSYTFGSKRFAIKFDSIRFLAKSAPQKVSPAHAMPTDRRLIKEVERIGDIMGTYQKQ